MTAVIYLAVFLVAALAALLAVSWLQIHREKMEAAREAQIKAPHVHRWRSITEYARQCDDRSCSVIEIAPGSPDGMPDYLQLMTTKQAAKNPIQEAEIYRNLDPRMLHGKATPGKMCDDCGRVYPAFFPWCCYCDERAIPHMIYDEESKTMVLFEQRKVEPRHAKRIESKSSDN